MVDPEKQTPQDSSNSDEASKSDAVISREAIETIPARLTQGSVKHQIISLSMPMMWGILANMAFNAADTFFVARLGADPLAAMAFTFPVVMMVTSVAIGLGAGSSSAIARAHGEGDFKKVQRVATDALILSLFWSLLIGIVGYFTIDKVFLAMGAKEELLPYLNDYMSIWYLSAWLMVVPLVGLSAARAMGNSLLQGRVMIGASLINIILDPILIFGLFGMPRLELEGAAIASVIGRSVSLCITLYYLHFKMKILTNPIGRLADMLDSYKSICRVGIPAFGTNVIIPVSHGVIVAMVATYGKEAVAGLGIATRLEPVALVFFYALSSIIGPFVGQNLGARKKDRIEKAISLSAAYCLLIGAVMAVILALFSGHMVGVFTESEEVKAIAVSYLTIVPLSYGTAGIVMIVNASFNGLGRPIPAVVVSIFRVFIFYLPMAYLLNMAFKIEGIFVASCVVNFVVGIGAYYWLRRLVNSLFKGTSVAA